MGRTHTLTTAGRTRVRPAPLLRAIDVLVGVVALVLAAPLLAVLALSVRLSSHGPVLQRRPAVAPDGRRVELLSFRTVLDGGRTEAHQRIRAVVGAADAPPLTGPGRVMHRLRLDGLPRLVNLVRGHVSLFG
jgi:lipopolysaccharide/colanic/teichoic acid biosynthesis glycosyltransferase